MIRRLSGTVVSANAPIIVLDVSGVGYELLSATLNPQPNDPLIASVFTVVREDAITLYGFRDETERGLFAMLLNVNGVGPKSALAIIGTMSADTISQALANNDAKPFTAVKGIGKKAAERIVVDLAGSVHHTASTIATSTLEIASALENLGFSRREYQPLLAKLPTGTVEEQLGWALQNLVR